MTKNHPPGANLSFPGVWQDGGRCEFSLAGPTPAVGAGAGSRRTGLAVPPAVGPPAECVPLAQKTRGGGGRPSPWPVCARRGVARPCALCRSTSPSWRATTCCSSPPSARHWGGERGTFGGQGPSSSRGDLHLGGGSSQVTLFVSCRGSQQTPAQGSTDIKLGRLYQSPGRARKSQCFKECQRRRRRMSESRKEECQWCV